MQKYNLHAKTKLFVGLRPRGILSLLGTLYPIEHSRSLSNPYIFTHHLLFQLMC